MPFNVIGLTPQPVYFDSANETAYYAFGTEFIAFTPTMVRMEGPAGQFDPAKLPTGKPGWLGLVLVTPPVQGNPLSNPAPQWLAPKMGGRGLGASIIVTGVPAQSFASTISTPTASPVAEKRKVCGVEQTKAELTDFLRAQFHRAIDTNDQISSFALMGQFSDLNPEVRTQIIGLDDAFLHSHGLEYFNAGIRTRGPLIKSQFADWVDAFWGK